MKECYRCKEVKDNSLFRINSDGKPQVTCADCVRESGRRSYIKYKEKRLERTRAARKKIQNFISDYKSTLSCENCGENHPGCLDFHHIDPNQKEMVIGHYNRNTSPAMIDKLKKEIKKCKVLCANCHRKEHYNQNHC